MNSYLAAPGVAGLVKRIKYGGWSFDETADRPDQAGCIRTTPGLDALALLVQQLYGKSASVSELVMPTPDD